MYLHVSACIWVIVSLDLFTPWPRTVHVSTCSVKRFCHRPFREAGSPLCTARIAASATASGLSRRVLGDPRQRPASAGGEDNYKRPAEIWRRIFRRSVGSIPEASSRRAVWCRARAFLVGTPPITAQCEHSLAALESIAGVTRARGCPTIPGNLAH